MECLVAVLGEDVGEGLIVPFPVGCFGFGLGFPEGDGGEQTRCVLFEPGARCAGGGQGCFGQPGGARCLRGGGLLVDGGGCPVLVRDDGGDEVVSVLAHTVRVAAGCVCSCGRGGVAGRYC